MKLLYTTSVFIASTLAVPAVTVIPLGNGENCVQWPSWIQSPDRTDTTGSLQFQVTSADDAAVNDLVTDPRTLPWGGSNVTNLVVDLRKSRSFAKATYRCIDGVARLSYGGFDDIHISKDTNNAFLTLGPGYDLEPYAHEIDGVRQDGVFLGTMNRTTWGFRYASPPACGELDYYEAKLQDLPEDPDTPPTAGYPPSFKGFLKIVPYY